MRISHVLIAGLALPLAACMTSPYGYGFDRYGSSRYGYNPYGTVGVIGALGGAYGANFSQAAAGACANYASRFGRVSVRNVQRLDGNHAKVFGYVNRGYRNEGWDCTFRSDGHITDFDL